MSKIYFTILGYLLWLMGRNIKKQGKQENTESYL
mgnify:FL=1